VIFHVDIDAFFVSVEEIFDPSLKGKAVIVGGLRDERGVVAAASYAARKFGIHSAMPLRTAARQAPPEAIFMEGHPQRYREYSTRVYEVLKSFSPLVEMASVDEAYLDMGGTERLHGPPLRAADLLHHKMKLETQLTCSIGIAASRLMAKIASDEAKPNGVLLAIPGGEPAILSQMKVRKLPGVGKVTERQLNALGIETLGQLAAYDPAGLRERFGDSADVLREKALGQDAGGWFESRIAEDLEPKSISHEHTFEQDTADTQKLESTLMRLSEMVARRLREQALQAWTLQLKLRYSDFTTITRAKTSASPTNVDGEIFDVIRTLFRANWKRPAAVRLLGVQASTLARACGAEQQQLGFEHSSRHDRWSRALGAADKLREKYGEGSVMLGGGMASKFREKVQEHPAGLRRRRNKRGS